MSRRIYRMEKNVLRDRLNNYVGEFMATDSQRLTTMLAILNGKSSFTHQVEHLQRENHRLLDLISRIREERDTLKAARNQINLLVGALGIAKALCKESMHYHVLVEAYEVARNLMGDTPQQAPMNAALKDLTVHGKAYLKMTPPDAEHVPLPQVIFGMDPASPEGDYTMVTLTDLAALQEQERRITEEAAAYASNLKGKHATTGATYATLVHRIKKLENDLASLTAALGKKGVGAFANSQGGWDITLPTDALDADLLQRVAEIYHWRKTGILKGEALRQFAKHTLPDEGDGYIRMAENITILQFLERMLNLLIPSAILQTCEPVQRSGESAGCAWTTFNSKE